MGSFTAKKAQSLIREGKPGRNGDGNGLHLMIPKAGLPIGCSVTPSRVNAVV